jgi:choline dehydrogenase-like flavoprotein
MYFKNLIIGSGPTGVVAASEILKKNKDVLILDVGLGLEEENLKIKNNFLRDKNIKAFKDEINNYCKSHNRYKNPNLKFPFGSDFVFRNNGIESFFFKNNLDIVSSNAEGGLSNIWGTICSPFFREDIKNWDIKYSEYYRNLKDTEELIPIMSSADNLDNFFDVKIGKKHNYNLSELSQDLMFFLNENEEDLNKNGIFYGRSKLAVSNKYSFNKVDCQECGLCHYGCPYDCMFNAKFLLEELKNNKDFAYKNNILVISINRKDQNNILKCYDFNKKHEILIECRNLFICSGAFSTAHILLRSNLVKKKKLTLKESQRFYIPFFYKGKTGNNIQEKKNTLPELFLEVFNKNICEKSIHLQFYTFNDLMFKPFKKIFGPFSGIFLKFFSFFFNRVVVLVGYLHSDYSSKINISLNNNLLNSKIDVEVNDNSKKIINKTILFLKEKFSKKFLIFDILLNINSPGSSYHYGSSLPMTLEVKQEDCTNLNGELSNYSNIYVLDSSILPDMPASPTTFNTAVNVSRIINNLSKENIL